MVVFVDLGGFSQQECPPDCLENTILDSLASSLFHAAASFVEGIAF